MMLDFFNKIYYYNDIEIFNNKFIYVLIAQQDRVVAS